MDHISTAALGLIFTGAVGWSAWLTKRSDEQQKQIASHGEALASLATDTKYIRGAVEEIKRDVRTIKENGHGAA